LDEIFGDLAKLSYDDWCHKVVSQAPWVLDSNQLRKQIFLRA